MNRARWIVGVAALVLVGASVVAALRAAEVKTKVAAKKAKVVATHREETLVGFKKVCRVKRLRAFCIGDKERVLLGDVTGKLIKVVGPEDKHVATWQLDFAPYAICNGPDGSVYVTGVGTGEAAPGGVAASLGVVVQLDAKGKTLKKLTSGESELPSAKPSGITCTDNDVFISYPYGAGKGLRGVMVRCTKELAEPKTIVTGLIGCCGNLDIEAHGGNVYVAENAGHRVVWYDRTGKRLGRWGKRDRVNVEGFGGCCNPMAIAFDAEGTLYTSESGPDRVKRYTAEGKFLGLVGTVGRRQFDGLGKLASSCSNSKARPNSDGSKVYVLDEANNVLRVLVRTATADSTDKKEGSAP